MKALLNDPDAQYRVSRHETIATYPVRAAAKAAMKAWGIEADAVIEETKPSESMPRGEGARRGDCVAVSRTL